MLICILTVAAVGLAWSLYARLSHAIRTLNGHAGRLDAHDERLDAHAERLEALEFHTRLHAELTRPTWDRPGGVWVPGVVPADDPAACRCRWEGRGDESEGGNRSNQAKGAA